MDRIKLIGHLIRWRLSWTKRNLDYMPKSKINPKIFITVREAAALISDEACVVSSGFAGSARCSVFFWAIREAFLRTGHPKDLVWMNVAAQGSRGRVPGTVEELGLPGLMKQYITGHHETAKAQLKLAEAGQLELQTIPQGVMTLLFEAQARRETHINSEVGLSTFMDPRVGKGSQVTPNATDQLVEAAADHLRYTLPKIEVALFNAPYADSEGNIYFKNAACLSETIPSSRAARANGGLVIATVSGLIPKEEAAISMTADQVDYIVVHPYNEQIISVTQQRYWPMFTPEASVSIKRATQQLQFINKALKITPIRNAVDHAIARLAAKVFVKSVPKGVMVNIGVGYPEEVARYLVEAGLSNNILFTTESGVYGGLPVPGIFFGSAIGPQKLISSLDMFKLYQQQLDVAILGFLQVDRAGNVNASKRGPKITDYVGPGGFPDIVDGAKTVIFVGSWMAKAKYTVQNGSITLVQAGKPKFVEQVDEITFAASEGLRKGKQVFYITHAGVFKLTEQGLQLIEVMPGIDVQKDIIETYGAQFIIPPNETIPVVDSSIVTGHGFQLKWEEKKEIIKEKINY